MPTPAVPQHAPFQFYRRLSWVLLGGLILLVLAVYRDFGIIWDEPNHQYYGLRIIDYFARFFDPSVFPMPAGEITRETNYLLYGGLFDVLAGLCFRLFGGDPYETRHLVNALVGVVGIIGAWRLARLLGGYRAAFLAGLLLSVEPSYFGHMFNNPKDIPFAAGYVWTIYYLLLALEHLPRLPGSLAVKIGLAIGCMAGVRTPGLVGFAYWSLACVVYAFAPAWFSRVETPAVRPQGWLKPLAASSAVIFLTAYALMVACWPWAQQNPLVRPFKAYRLFSNFRDWQGTVLFDGAFVNAAHLPVVYLPQYFLVKLPEVVVLSLGLAVVLGIYALFAGRRGSTLDVTRWAFLGVAALFPPAFAIINGSVMYDTIRHFLFLIPLFCVAGGAALHRCAGLLAQKHGWMGTGVLAATGLAVSGQLTVNALLHPNEYVYYNRLTGGPGGASGRYEMDYWGNSYKEAVTRMTAYVRRTKPDAPDDAVYRVYVCGPYLSASYYFPDRFILVSTPDDADFFISFTRVNCHLSVPGTPVAAVIRMGALLSVVKALRTGT